MTQSQRPVRVTIPPRTMAGFALYENDIHKLAMQYPSTWYKQEIPLSDEYTGLEVLFAAGIAVRFSKEEDSEAIFGKIRDIVYNQCSARVVLSLKRLSLHESYTVNDVTDDHLHALRICFDNVNLLERAYDSKMGEIPASKLLYSYTDPLQNHLPKEGMKIISVKSHKEIALTYSSQSQDFDRFLPAVHKMIDTLSIEI